MSTIREVARLAGVSPATVSRVMNGTANVDSDKRQRVEQAIKESGFLPNKLARALFKNSSGLIGLIIPNIENPFFNEMARVIEEEAYAGGLHIVLCSSGNNTQKELDNIRTYMHIQQYRFSNKFDFQVFIHDERSDVMNARIPKMTLQPIVENAIFHGMENKLGKGHIEIHIEYDEQNVFIIIEDDGVGMNEEDLAALRSKLAASADGHWDTGHESNGIAMRNINNRLKLLYGENCGITVSSLEGVGTEVELTLPRHFRDEEEEKNSEDRTDAGGAD